MRRAQFRNSVQVSHEPLAQPDDELPSYDIDFIDFEAKEIEPDATGVNGARMVVDMWRNLYTLNFEHFEGPGGRTEPSVSTWLPTTPEG